MVIQYAVSRLNLLYIEPQKLSFLKLMQPSHRKYRSVAIVRGAEFGSDLTCATPPHA